MKKLLTLVLIALMGFFGTGTAHADELHIAVCVTLDDYNSISGVLGVAKGLVKSGYTPFQAGQIIATAVQNVCPEHAALVDRFMNAIDSSYSIA